MKSKTIRLSKLRTEIEFGRHSGFPPCCILFFVGYWNVNYTSKEARAYCKMARRAATSIGLDLDYIPCPNCVRTKSFVRRIHWCGPQCMLTPITPRHSWKFRKVAT